VPADHGRAEQLAPSRLLVGAGVADDGEQADQPDQDGQEAGPPGDELAQAGAGQGAVEGDEAGIVGVLEALGGGEDVAEDPGVAGQDQAEERDPQRQQPAVAPHDQPDQLAGADQGAHHATSACPPAGCPARS
jgi:hypothetical protein